MTGAEKAAWIGVAGTIVAAVLAVLLAKALEKPSPERVIERHAEYHYGLTDRGEARPQREDRER